MTAMQILLAKSGIEAHRNLRRFRQQRSHQSIALLGDRAQFLPSARTFLARNQSQITRHRAGGPSFPPWGFLSFPNNETRVPHPSRAFRQGGFHTLIPWGLRTQSLITTNI